MNQMHFMTICCELSAQLSRNAPAMNQRCLQMRQGVSFVYRTINPLRLL